MSQMVVLLNVTVTAVVSSSGRKTVTEKHGKGPW